MKIKLPDYVVKDSFRRVVSNTDKVSSSHRFIYKGNCPVCGDKRQRLYIKDYGDDHMVYCHNCAYSKNFYSFLKDCFPHEVDGLKEHFLNSMQDGSAFKKKKTIQLKDRLNYQYSELDRKLRQYANKYGFSIKKVQDDAKMEKYRKKCLKYFVKRKLPKSFIRNLWCFTDRKLAGYCGIPFFDESGKNIIHWQGRRMWETVKGSDDEKYNPKYKFLKDVDEGIEIEDKPLYRMNQVNKKLDVQITEGAIDAEFFENGSATSGATISEDLISRVKKIYPYRVWVPDNIWIDQAGLKLTIRLLKMGESVFIFPYGTKEKDANYYVMNNNLNNISNEFVQSNTYKGKHGLIKLKCIALKNKFEWPKDYEMQDIERSWV